MNKQKFNQVIKDRSRIGEKELIQLVELGNDYPYSQVIHTLIAKGSHNKKLSNYPSKLHRAALYVTDRGVLKHVIEDTIVDQPPTPVVKEKAPAKSQQKTVAKKVVEEPKQAPVKTPKAETKPAKVEAKPTAKKAAAKPGRVRI